MQYVNLTEAAGLLADLWPSATHRRYLTSCFSLSASLMQTAPGSKQSSVKCVSVRLHRVVESGGSGERGRVLWVLVRLIGWWAALAEAYLHSGFKLFWTHDKRESILDFVQSKVLNTEEVFLFFFIFLPSLSFSSSLFVYFVFLTVFFLKTRHSSL